AFSAAPRVSHAEGHWFKSSIVHHSFSRLRGGFLRPAPLLCPLSYAASRERLCLQQSATLASMCTPSRIEPVLRRSARPTAWLAAGRRPWRSARASESSAPTAGGGVGRSRGRVSASRIEVGSIDDLICAQQQRRRDGQPERLGGLEVDDEFERGGLLDGQVG